MRAPDGIDPPRDHLTRLLVAAGIAGPVVAWSLSLAAGAAWPGYDPLSGSISDLVNGPAGEVQVLAFLASGALGLAWAVGMRRVLGVDARDARRVALLLGFLALLSFAFAAFPTDHGELGITLAGRLHLVVFAVYSVSLPMVMWWVAEVMRRDPRWTRLGRPTPILGAVLAGAVLLVPVTLYGPLLPWLGLLERIYVALPSAWQVAVALAALGRLRRA